MALDNVRKLVGDCSDNGNMAIVVAGMLSKAMGKEVVVGKSKVIMHPSEMWDDESENKHTSVVICPEYKVS